MENIIKIKGIEFYEKELNDLYFNKNKKFIVKYKNIYQLKYSNINGFYAVDIYKNYDKKALGYTRRGRFIVTNANQVNDLIGRVLVND